MKPTPFELLHQESKDLILKIIGWKPAYINDDTFKIMKSIVLRKQALETSDMSAKYNEIVLKAFRINPGLIHQFKKSSPIEEIATFFDCYTVKAAYAKNVSTHYLFQFFNRKGRFEKGTLIIQNEPYLWTIPTPIQIVQYRKRMRR